MVENGRDDAVLQYATGHKAKFSERAGELRFILIAIILALKSLIRAWMIIC